MRDTRSSWLGALAVAALAAALVAATGVGLARRVERVKEKSPGNRVDDAFREVARRIGALEELWREALEADAQRMLQANAREDHAPAACGIVQWSWLNPAFSQPERAHRRRDGCAVSVRPVLDKFANKAEGEWVFPENDAIRGAGWVEIPGHPLAWRQGNCRTAVVFLLDPRAAAGVVRESLLKHPPSALPPGDPGSLVWTGPDGMPWLREGRTEAEGQPDEILRHVSRFGDWTLRRYYPVATVVTWRTPVLAGAFALAALLLAAGAAAALWLRKAIRLAEQRVSFVNRVSHELRAPLTNLLLNTDLALDATAPGDAAARKRLGLIREESSRLARIVDNVLEDIIGRR